MCVTSTISETKIFLDNLRQFIQGNDQSIEVTSESGISEKSTVVP